MFRAAADALAHHPTAQSRRIVRHRVVNLLRAGDVDAAAALLHGHTAHLWGRTRDAAATLRDLALLDGRLEGAAAGDAPALARRGAPPRGQDRGRAPRGRGGAAALRGAGDAASEAHCLRLLGHIASDLGAPAHGRRLVARALALFEELGDEHGQAQCEVVIGEIDYLLGEHGARATCSRAASERFLKAGDWLGRAPCLVLQGWVEQAGGSPAFARELMRTARADFDAIGYRLGMAQCDVTLAHADHREGDFAAARAGAARRAPELPRSRQPARRGGCERLLAMIALDAGVAARRREEHARAAAKIYARLADPWGEVETRLLLAQVALDRGDADGARASTSSPARRSRSSRPSRSSTATSRSPGSPTTRAASRTPRARSTPRAPRSRTPARTGDHTPQLLERFARMGWPKPASTRIASWRRHPLGRAGGATASP